MIITPNWPLEHVKAFTTTRLINGKSLPPYQYFNLGLHVGDNLVNVESNRKQLIQAYGLPSSPIWLNQTHSTVVLDLDMPFESLNADASFTHKTNMVCAVMTADCLPILIADKQAKTVAAIHAGWRSLAHGIIEQTIKKLLVPTQELYAWLGPAISQAHFEVGNDVKSIFLAQGFNTKKYFQQTSKEKWHADIYGLATERLMQLNIKNIYGGEYCTYTNDNLFYSYRREQQTGRMASVIWML